MSSIFSPVVSEGGESNDRSRGEHNEGPGILDQGALFCPIGDGGYGDF